MTRVLTLSISVTIAGQAKKTIRLPRGFLPAQKNMSKWKYICFGDLSLCGWNAWTFSLGTCENALDRLD